MTAYSVSYPPRFDRPAGPRPGLVTAIGVTSIVVASLCLLAGVIGGFWTMAMYRSAQMVATAASGASARGGSGASLPALALPTPEELEVDAEQKRAARFNRRSGLLDLLDAVKPLSPEIRVQIDGMLARHAERVLPKALLTADEVSSTQVQAMIANVGTMPPVSAGDGEGVFFQFKETGRLEAYATRAVFKPSDGGSTLRTSGPATAAEEDQAIDALPPPPAATGPEPAAIPPPPRFQMFPSGLSSQEVQSVVQKAQAATGGKLNNLQVTTITNVLQNTSPPLVKSQMVYSPIRLATVQPDGGALVVFSDGMLSLDVTGNVIQQSTNNIAEITLDPIGLTLMVGEAIAAAALAGFLLWTGILVLRNSPKAHTFLWMYALLKLPMTVLGAVAFAWVMQDLMSGIGRLGGGGSAGNASGIAIAIGVVGAIFPFVLMLLLMSPTVRGYFAAREA